MARRIQLETSLEVWRNSISVRLSELQTLVYSFVYHCGERGATQDEVSEYFAPGRNTSTWRSRVPELEKLGLLKMTTVKRLNKKGNWGYVWVAKMPQMPQ